ncbi:hypothetical protein C0J52_20782 [Blattella germanica]|nr:hypothetical protein C0J52_20782 [Blattella germanica]
MEAIFNIFCEGVLVLLKLSDREGRETGDSILAERLKIQNEELEKMESLHKELEEKTHEIEILRSQEKSPKFKKKRSSQQSTVPTLLLDLSETDEDYDEMEDDINDPDWQKTPIFKRIQKLKNKTICTQPEQEGAVKRTSDGQTKCNCKGICKNRLCGCRKLNSRCSKDCKCDHAQCHNMDNAVKLFSEDSSSESINDENNDPEEDNFKRPRYVLHSCIFE